MEDCTGSLCLACLVAGTSTPLYTYDLKDPALKAASSCNQITVCGTCRSHAKVTDTFLSNVRLAQTILNSVSLQQEGVWESIERARLRLAKITELKRTLVHIVDMDGQTDLDDDGNSSDIGSSHGTISVKQENEDYEEEPVSLSDVTPKEINHSGMNLELYDIKLEMKDVDVKCEKGKVFRLEDDNFEKPQTGKNEVEAQKQEVKSNNVQFEKDPARRENNTKVEVLVISMQELRAERDQMRQDKQYASAKFRCEACIKFFAYKETYDRHMEEHTDKFGRLSCDVCGRRARTSAQLASHRSRHLRRYRCTRCGYTRLTRQVVAEHYAAEHSQSTPLQCEHCAKVYLKRAQLRHHITTRHGEKKRMLCEICCESFADVQSLRSHVKTKHSDAPIKREVPCEQCGLMFKYQSQLKKHMIKHALSKEFYCVECDRRFQSEAALKRHFMFAKPHAAEESSLYICDHCNLRFSTKHKLSNHINKVHLKLLPYKCDRCDKEYLTSYSLRGHIQMIHEGFKRPVRYPCTMCDKGFDRMSLLKIHLLNHTRERPYQCPKCPETFAQSGALSVHKRLVHKRLQRNGESKAD